MPEGKEWRYLVAGLLASDFICLMAGLVVAQWLATVPLGEPANRMPVLALLLPLIVVAITLVQGNYDVHNLLGGTQEYAAVFRACTYGLVTLIVIGFALHQALSRGWFLFSWVLITLAMGCARFAIRRIVYRLRTREFFVTRALIVGADADGAAVARQLDGRNSGVRVVGFLDDYAPPGSVVSGGLRVLGTPSALLQLAARTGAREAIVVPQALPWETVRSLMANAAGFTSNLRVHLSAGFDDLLTSGVRLSERNHVTLLTVRKVRLTPFEATFKRTLDYLLAVVLLVVFAPVFAATAVRIRLRGPGQVLDRRLVYGRYGKQFEQLSFRVSAPLRRGFVAKLPGLLNVLRGELSLVGPRPVSLTDTRAPASLKNSFTVRPGLTGPWRQVNDPSEQAVFDLYYIRNYSVWMDLQVLFRRISARLPRPHRDRGGGAKRIEVKGDPVTPAS